MRGPAKNVVKFAVKIGVDKDGERVTALFLVFTSLVEAERYAVEARDVSTIDLIGNRLAVPQDIPRAELLDPGYVAVGATIDFYSEARGTFDSIDVY